MSITTLHLDDAGKTGATINNHHFHHETQFLKNKTENNPKNKTNKDYPESQIWKMIQRTHQIFKLCYKKKKKPKRFHKKHKAKQRVWIFRNKQYLDRDLAITLGPLELLDPLLHDLLRQQRHRHFCLPFWKISTIENRIKLRFNKVKTRRNMKP